METLDGKGKREYGKEHYSVNDPLSPATFTVDSRCPARTLSVRSSAPSAKRPPPRRQSPHSQRSPRTLSEAPASSAKRPPPGRQSPHSQRSSRTLGVSPCTLSEVPAPSASAPRHFCGMPSLSRITIGAIPVALSGPSIVLR